jgi:lactoylglutathione lyase
MKTRISPLGGLAAVLVALALLESAPSTRAAEATNTFSKPTIDIGIVARDVEKSAKFYSETIGLKEIKGFSATPEFGKKIGLVDGHPIAVRVFVTDEIDGATRIKLMSFPGAGGKLPDRSFIHSTVGINYLTLFVKDMDETLARLKKAEAKLLGETPVSVGGKNQLVVVRDPDGNFVELIGPTKN